MEHSEKGDEGKKGQRSVWEYSQVLEMGLGEQKKKVCRKLAKSWECREHSHNPNILTSEGELSL